MQIVNYVISKEEIITYVIDPNTFIFYHISVTFSILPNRSLSLFYL